MAHLLVSLALTLYVQGSDLHDQDRLRSHRDALWSYLAKGKSHSLHEECATYVKFNRWLLDLQRELQESSIDPDAAFIAHVEGRESPIVFIALDLLRADIARYQPGACLDESLEEVVEHGEFPR